MLKLAQRNPDALELAERAVAAAPDRADVRDTLAQAHAGAGRLDRALKAQEGAVALAPEAPAMRMNLARLYLRTGDLGKAGQEIAWLCRQPPERVNADALRELEKRQKG